MAHHYSNYSEISSIQGFNSHNHDFFGAHQAGFDTLGKQQSFFTVAPAAAEMTTSSVSRRWDDSSSSSSSWQLKAAAAAHLHQQQQQLLLMQQEHGGMMGNYFQAPLHQQEQPLHLMRNSRFLRAAQELLKEFCSPGSGHRESGSKKKTSLQDQEAKNSAALYSMESLELQKIKDKLLSMLDEVDKRYKKYCEQMRMVVVSFEAAAGEEAATVYSALASKAMSRHFRCLRDGIVGQLRSVTKAMGEKNPVVEGTAAASRGETPRLKVLDRYMRQQKAFQQGFMEQPPWRPQRGLPERSVSILRAWLFEHFLHPYPSDVDKHILAKQTGLTRSQVSNWFINARVRLWKPMVEEMYLQEMKGLDNDNNNSSGSGKLAVTGVAAPREEDSDNPNSNLSFDRKPPLLLAADSESLSSIININMNNVSSHHHQHHRHQQQQHQSRFENFGVVVDDLEFYGGGGGGSNSKSNESRSGVSLTLGLQQHSMNGGGMGLSLLPNSSLLFSRESNVHGGEQLLHGLGGGGDQNRPYRNLMEAKLLHDLAR